MGGGGEAKGYSQHSGRMSRAVCDELGGKQVAFPLKI